MSPMGKCLMGKCFKQIYLTQTVLNNWIYPVPGPDRAHRHKQNCIYPQLFGFKPVLRTYALHTTSSIIEYIPPPLGLTGPTDRKTKLHISTIVWLQISFLLIYFAHNILYNWIYPTSGPDRAHRHKVNSTFPAWVNVLKLMSVGPVGPGGGIYPIIDDVVCKVNFQKLIWRPNINGYMQLCLCLWALSGPEVGYIQV